MAIYDEAKAILDEWGTDLINDLKKSLGDKKHIAITNAGEQSALLGSMTFTVFNRAETFYFEFYFADYGNFIDKGTKGAKRSGNGGKQMQESIRQWMVGKGISKDALSIYKSKLKNPEKSKVTFKQAESSLAWAIKKQINKKGIIKRFGYRGSNWFTSVINDGRQNDLANRLTELLGREVTIELNI